MAPNLTPGGQESCWGIADKPRHRPAGKPSTKRLVPRSWPWSPSDGGCLSFYQAMSREMFDRSRVCRKQASCLLALHSLGSDVTGSEVSSWGRRRTM